MTSMEFHLLSVLALLCVVMVGSNAVQPAEVYWGSKWPNTPIPQDLQNLLQSDTEDNGTFWDMGFQNTFDDKRKKYGKHYENAFEEDVNDHRKKYRKHYENAFEEDVDDKRKKYGKHYENAFEEDVDDKRKKYGKHYQNAFEEDVDDKRKKYGKHYENAFEEDVDDKRKKYGKHYQNAFEEDVDDKRKKYGKHYENAFEEDVDDKRKKYGKHYENAFEEDVNDKRKKYGKHYENAFEEDVNDKRKKYGKHYENAFEEDVDDHRKKYGKHYENAFEEDVNDHRKKYGRKYGMKSQKLRLPNSTVFFVYDDFHAGQKMRLHITKSFNYARFLPRQIADAIPFSKDKLSEILKRFSITPESSQAKVIKQTIEDCESPGIKGEDRYCPTSLEALVDFSFKYVGDNAKILFNEINEPKRVQEYTILDVKFVGENHIVCHKEKYPYAVYYCHTLNGTKVYTASLLGADSTKANAVAVCHSDTSNWNPGHLAFLLLNIKPGDGTVCHFIRSDTLVVVSAKEKSSNQNILLSTS